MVGKKLSFLDYSIFKKSIFFFFYLDLKIKHRIFFNLSFFINYFFLNSYLYAYNGLNLKKCNSLLFKLNYKFGEFVFTRRFYKFFKNKKSNILLKKR